MVTPPTVTWSPVQPRSLDFVQPGVGLLSGFHLDGASVIVTVLAPPGGGVRGNILVYCSFAQRGPGVGSCVSGTLVDPCRYLLYLLPAMAHPPKLEFSKNVIFVSSKVMLSGSKL